MPLSFPSALIRMKRLERSWSQEGLCQGICAVSYLSKIEQGKAEPNADILRALLRRLEVEWHEECAPEAGKLTEDWWEAIRSSDPLKEEKLRLAFQEKRSLYLNGPHMLDLLLLQRLSGCSAEPEDHCNDLSQFENCLSARQRVWYLLAQRRFEEAFLLLPNAFTALCCGSIAYHEGSYPLAVERLLQSCSMAAEEGRARVLLRARALLGNCYSNQGDFETMRRHYQAVERLATDLGDADMLRAIRYNTAATQMQLGDYGSARDTFSSFENPSALTLHKLAVCEEKLGHRAEALHALERADQLLEAGCQEAEYPDSEWIRRMCALVRYRLEHPDYLHDTVYGEALLSLYDGIKRELSSGFALFHQPWVEEWYVASRQYKQAYELKK